MKTLSIIIPVFNEEKTIDTILKQVFASKTDGYKKEIIVVDDCSKDSTLKQLDKWRNKVILLSTPKNSGKGAAIRVGLKDAKGDIILIQDADLEYSPDDYPKLLAPFDKTQVQVVYGSRFLGPHLSTMYLYAVGNKFVTWMTNVLYNTTITDMETGYKVFRKECLSGIVLHSNKFDIEPELTAKLLKKGFQVYEVPISYFGRKFSEGKKLTWRDGVGALWTLLKYRFVD